MLRVEDAERLQVRPAAVAGWLLQGKPEGPRALAPAAGPRRPNRVRCTCLLLSRACRGSRWATPAPAGPSRRRAWGRTALHACVLRPTQRRHPASAGICWVRGAKGRRRAVLPVGLGLCQLPQPPLTTHPELSTHAARRPLVGNAVTAPVARWLGERLAAPYQVGVPGAEGSCMVACQHGCNGAPPACRPASHFLAPTRLHFLAPGRLSRLTSSPHPLLCSTSTTE